MYKMQPSHTWISGNGSRLLGQEDVSGGPCAFSPGSSGLLHCFLSNAGIVFSRREETGGQDIGCFPYNY